MTREQIFQQIQQKQSYLCVGLDTDITKIPAHLRSAADPVFEFNKQIIDATADYCVAYKPNTAFYEAQGVKGWESLQKTLEYIPASFFTIADAKRGDIGNTSGLYARAFFEQMSFDAITVAPYMGRDSVTPFLEFPEKWVILLALTSNAGSADFQRLTVGKENTATTAGNQPLFERVIQTSRTWADDSRMMYVVGATQASQFAQIRQLVPEHFLLVPGVGAQGGDLQTLSRLGMNRQCGLLVNASRAILYASGEKDFARSAAAEAQKLQQEMADYLEKYA
jgi:orotidine-5'-phosphate decarboxylase